MPKITGETISADEWNAVNTGAVPMLVISGGSGAGTLSMPGYAMSGSSVVFNATVNRMNHVPFYVETPTTIDALVCCVDTAVAGNARMGLYKANDSMQPDTLIVDSGLVSVGTTGTKTVTFTPITLAGGWYIAVIVVDVAAGLKAYQCPTPWVNNPATTNGAIRQFYRNTVGTGALPSSGATISWNAIEDFQNHFLVPVFFRVSDPTP